jgi:GWxTD domain-containing protein
MPTRKWLTCMIKRWTALILTAILVLLPSCMSLRRVVHPATPVVLYNPGRTALHPEFTVYHNSETESTLFFRLLTSELLFNQANPQMKDQARLRLSYVLYASMANNEVAARDSQSFVFDKEKAGEQISSGIRIPTEPGKTYLIDIRLDDLLRNTTCREFILVDRFSEFPQQDYLLLNHPGSRVSFERYFYPGEHFRLMKRNMQADRIHISVFPPRDVLPLPPYSMENQADLAPLPDSTFTASWSEQQLFMLGGQGIYIFHSDPGRSKGLCLTQFGDRYPQVRLPEDMIPPLQYLTTREEFAAIVSKPDPKKAVDEFWIDKGKTAANARDLIRVYYNRVTFANIYFASSRQGWQTDRGMIYLVMGPPSMVEKTETREVWVYEMADSNRVYRFEFNLTDDYWMGYDFSLKRSENHRIPWNMAIESWRKGKIFSL